MNINSVFQDEKLLNSQIKFHIERRQIRRIKPNAELVQSHIQKAKHNITFFKLNRPHKEHKDWQIVALYYALYHASLALITNKNFTSTNHHATILLLIKEYTIPKEEINLINELSINQKDAQLYTTLKLDRHNASYSTQTLFTTEQISKYQKQVISFINKAEEIISNG